MYEDRGRRPDVRGDYRRSQRRYSPAHDVADDRRDAPLQYRRPRSYARDDYDDSRRWDRDPSSYLDYDDQSHSRSPRRDYRSGLWRARQRSPGYERQERSPDRRRSRSPRYGGPRSRDVIMEGLPAHTEEDDVCLHPQFINNDLRKSEAISKQLRSDMGVAGIESIRIIKDRQTGLSRPFGFLRFAAISDAEKFLDRHHPYISITGATLADPKSRVANEVRVSFCRERDDKTRTANLRDEEEWVCMNCSLSNFARRLECRRCQTAKSDSLDYADSGGNQFVNTGDNDVAQDGVASQFLLFRGLEPSVTEEMLAKGASKLFKANKSSTQSGAEPNKKPNSKAASTGTDANLGAREGSLKRVMLVRDRQSEESWGYGFAEFLTTDDSQAALAKYRAQDRFTIASKLVDISFIHAGVFVPVFNSNTQTDEYTFNPLSNPSLKLAYWDEAAFVRELVVSADEGPPDQSAKSRLEGVAKGGKQSQSRTKKRKAEATAAAANKKTAPAHLNFWHNRHAELHGVSARDSKDNEETNSKFERREKKLKEEAAPPSQSFAELSRKCCLLCARQFKTEGDVNRHERLSQLHRDNMANDEVRERGLKRMAKAEAMAKQEGTAYRDRAKERRAAFNQPKQPGAKKQATPPSNASPPPATANAPQSKGAALLGKMGWSTGAGLGAQGEGMTAPIQTEVYVQGAGLGAQGGKVGDAAEEAGRNTRSDYAEFVDKTKEKAKARFESMG